MRAVEGNQVGECPAVDLRRIKRREIGVDRGLELIEQRLELGRVHLLKARRRLQVDDHGALVLERRARIGEQAGGVRMRLLGYGHRADSDAVQPKRLEVGAVHAEAKRALADHRGEHGGIRHRAAHGAGRVLARRDRHNAFAADGAHRGFEAYEAVERRRRQDGAVGLGADGGSAEACRCGDPGAGARAGRVAIAGVGISGLATHRAPAARGACRTEIGPFAQVRLAQHDCAGGAQPPDERRIGRAQRPRQRQGSRGRGDRVGSLDVVFDNNGNSMQWPAQLSRLAFRVESARGRWGIRIERENRPVLGTVVVEAGDTRHIRCGQTLGRDGTGREGLLQRSNGLLGGIKGALGACCELLERRGQRHGPRRLDEASAIHESLHCCVDATAVALLWGRRRSREFTGH